MVKAKIESPLGGQNISSDAKSLRNLEVPDASGYTPPTPTGLPIGGGHFSPSVGRRIGRPISEEELREFQERLAAQADSDHDLIEIEREVKKDRQERQAQLSGTSRLNEGARKRIEMLIGMTRGTRTIDIEGQDYILQTLKGKEMREAIAAASLFDGTIQSPYEVRKQLLGRSLISIAGIDMATFIGSNSLDDKLNFIEEQDEALLNRLYSEYLLMVEDSKNRYAIKTEADVKEVVEDLKK